ncbi:MAG: hypothetical protein WCJ62_12255, partial [Flavobacterium sp.]
EQTKKTLLSECGGNQNSDVAKLMDSAIELLEKSQTEKIGIETMSAEVVNFLIINKLAIVLEEPNENGNNLAGIHNREVVEVKEELMENVLASVHVGNANHIVDIQEAPMQNALADIHAGNTNGVVEVQEAPMQNALADIHSGNDEKLGETPEVLPTHLGGIELEKGEETTTSEDEVK